MSSMVSVYRTGKAGLGRSDGNSNSFLMIFLLGDGGQHEPRHVGSGNPPGPSGDLQIVLIEKLPVSPDT